MTIVPTILIVEDNPATLKMLRVTLESEGFRVMEALDGRTAIAAAAGHVPDLVLQDLILPDMNGFELVRTLRALPGFVNIPIFALSGFLGAIEDRRTVDAGFSGLLVKPIEPSQLVEFVRLYLPRHRTAVEAAGPLRRLLAVDDDPLMLKLASLNFSDLGFEVVTATGGAEGLAAARTVQPEVIVCDVQMPGMDGFQFCLEMRRDPALERVPVVLLSSSYRADIDHALARKVGAAKLVPRTPDFGVAAAAVREALEIGAPGAAEELSVELELEHARVVIGHLEEQLALTSGLAQRCTHQAAQLSLLSGVADALTRHTDPDVALRDVLAATLDAAGISKGALYLRGTDASLVLRHHIGFSEANRPGLADFFGHLSLLDQSAARGAAVSLPSPAVSPDIAEVVLAATQAASMHVVPLVSDGRGVGVMVLGAKRTDVTSESAVSFARAMGNQMVQSLELASTFTRLSASELRYRTLLESATDAIAVLTPEGIVRELNRRWEEILGQPGENVIGKRLHELLETEPWGFHRASGPHLGSGDEEAPAPWLITSPDRPPPLKIRRGDGSFVLLEFSNTALDLAGERIVFAAARDVTEQVRSHEQLMLSDRMATMGTIAAGVAHEINNPLTAVMANLDFVASDLARLAQKVGSAVDLSAMQSGVEEARVAAARVQNIARDLKVFSRAEDDVQEAVDLHRVLDSSLRMSWNEVRHRAQLQKDYGNIPPVLGNESRLGQVFLNLIINAAQAIEEGHADVNLIQVRTRYDAATDRVITDITDTGSGISSDDLPKLFTPFFTTKPSGVGTGLGLAMCQRIVTGLGGEITVNSVLGTGATFSVVLPSTQLKAPVVTPAEAVVPAQRRGRILVVDDEPMVGSVVQRTLAPEHDLTVLTSAADALALISKGERFDLILCDLMMPVMTGVEFHTALDEVAPDQAARMVFLTGGAFTPLARAFLDAVPNPRLNKPFALQALRNLVNEHLAKW